MALELSTILVNFTKINIPHIIYTKPTFKKYHASRCTINVY